MSRRNGYRRSFPIPSLDADRLERECGSVTVEVEFFFRVYSKGHLLDRLRADIAPGKDSSEWNRKFRLRVLAAFERRVARAEGRRAA